jgi:glutaredoxin 2
MDVVLRLIFATFHTPRARKFFRDGQENSQVHTFHELCIVKQQKSFNEDNQILGALHGLVDSSNQAIPVHLLHPKCA